VCQAGIDRQARRVQPEEGRCLADVESDFEAAAIVILGGIDGQMQLVVEGFTLSPSLRAGGCGAAAQAATDVRSRMTRAYMIGELSRESSGAWRAKSS